MVWWTNSANSQAYRNVLEVEGWNDGHSPIRLNVLLYSPGFHVSPLLGQVCFICCHCHNERAETLSEIFDLGLICCFQTLV